MPVAETDVRETAASGVTYRVADSLAADLVWALMVQPGEPDPERYPVRARRFESAPGLEQELREFWSDGVTCYVEVLLAADRGGVLYETQADRFWEGLERGAAARPRLEPLPTETPEEQAIFRERLRRLHQEADLRARWMDLLRRVWDAVGSRWEREGRAAAERFGLELEAKLEGVTQPSVLEDLLRSDFQGMLPRVVREYAAAGGDVVLAPTWFGRCAYVVGLREVLFVGIAVPSLPAGPTPATRSRALRFKALGDPTRLAIFEATARRPCTVGELAVDLGVAQPTVSNHVRVLRDAGLLAHARDRSKGLQADITAFEKLVDDASHALRRRPTGAVPVVAVG